MASSKPFGVHISLAVLVRQMPTLSPSTAEQCVSTVALLNKCTVTHKRCSASLDFKAGNVLAIVHKALCYASLDFPARALYGPQFKLPRGKSTDEAGPEHAGNLPNVGTVS